MTRLITFNPLGHFELVQAMYRGKMFDLFEVRSANKSYCLKSPARSPRVDLVEEPTYLSRATGVETSLWGGDTSKGLKQVTSQPDILNALLTLEAEKIRRTKGAWNHHVVATGIWDGEDDDWKLGDPLTPARFQQGLLMPYYDGNTFSHLPQEEQRMMWPRMLSSMWRALVESDHGDLSPDNIILGTRRFVLIDPGVQMLSSTSSDSSAADNLNYTDQALLFTCTPRYYPLLPPAYQAPAFLGNTPSVADHLRWLAALSRESALGPVIAGVLPHTTANQTAELQREVLPEGIKEQENPWPKPGPADLMAVGIIYYEILSGQHPFADFLPTGAPLWEGSYGEAGYEAANQYEHFLTLWQSQKLFPPSHYKSDVSPEEDQLAMGLLQLKVNSHVELMALLAGIMRQSEDKTW